MLRNLVRILTTAVAMAALAAPAQAAAQSPPELVGSASYTVTGKGPVNLVLIPGLASDASVFDGIVAALRDRYNIVTVTLAGYGGVPAPRTVSLDDDVASLARIVALQPGGRAVVVGHSLGGYLGLRLAAAHPELVQRLVVLDALPLFPPPVPGMSAEQRNAGLRHLADAVRNQDSVTFAAGERQFMTMMVSDPKAQQELVTMALRCSREAIAERMWEMETNDLTPLLPKITAPTLVVAPAGDPKDAAAIQALYTRSFTGLPRLDVTVITRSHHFMMYDQPQATLDAITKMASGAP